MTNLTGNSPLEALTLTDAFAGKTDQELLNLIAANLTFTAEAGASVQGSTGATGPSGSAGATGPAGAQGPAGPQGASGASSTSSFVGIITEATGARQLASSDIGSYLRCTNGAAVTLTIPLHATDPIPINSIMHVAQIGTGVVTATPEAGVTINGTAVTTQHKTLFLVKVAEDIWDSRLIS